MSEIEGAGWDDLEAQGAIDLGAGTKYTKVVDQDGNWIGINEWHLHPTTDRLCGGWVPFNVESKYLVLNAPKWEVSSYEPLTLSPSLQCTTCGHHGFIREGRWESC